jgi:PAS domain S-box-containing protein
VFRKVKERDARGRARREILQSEEYFRALVDNASDVVTVFDCEGKICYASPSVTKMLGYAPQEFVGKSIFDFIHSDDVDNARFVFMNNDLKKELTLEFRLHHRNGSWKGLEAVGKTMIDESGQARILMNSRDITDRILEQEALRESILRHLKTQNELQKTQQKIIKQERLAAIGQMSSGIAHDFSNALMPVLGFSEILLNHPEYLKDLERVRNYLKMINTSARDAMHIVGGLREFYRTKEKEESLLPLNLNKVVEQAILLTQPKWKQESSVKGVQINVEMDLSPLPDMIGNEAALREALTNLIFNAVDAMPKGGTITFKSQSEEGQLCLEISDTGTGMSEELRHRCFEPFFSTKGRGGTGLGLAMVYGVVRRHEGSIDLKSQEGKGSTFVIRLPIRNPASGENNNKKIISPAEKLIQKLSVLVVDDESMVRDVLRDYLNGDGHEVVTANDGVEALSLFKQKKFDLVITDRAMPEMNGDQLADSIKKISPQTPLIMLTGFGELMKAKEECPKGVDKLISKPLTFEGYREALAHLDFQKACRYTPLKPSK